MEDEEMANKSADESSESSDDDEEMNSKISEFESKIQDNPYLYDAYIELIKLLQNAGELNKLREVRQKMSEIFPLTEELWLDWLKDEIKMISKDEERDHVCRLFERAVKDYLSVDVWLEYVQFAIGGIGKPDGIQTARDVFERAITAAGLHVIRGAILWEAYREFENAVLGGLQPEPGSVSSTEQLEQLDAQLKRIVGLFKRQLSVPLLDMENTYVEYEEWCSGDTDAQVKVASEKAQRKLEKLQPFETALLRAEPPRLQQYLSYIEYELKEEQPARIQCIFERALAENCLIADLWNKYLMYLDTRLQVKQLTLSVYERAMRNCPWSANLWVGYIRALERHDESHNKIKETFDRALSGGVTLGQDYLELWRAYCDYLRRRISWNAEYDKELKELRNTFEKAITYLQEYFPADGDPDCILLQYWARIEAKFCNNMEKARELWNQIMTLGFANQAHKWLEYFNLERCYGDHKHCRKLLQRALNSVNDWPEQICDVYINYEREEGTLEQYDQAIVRTESQLERIQERRNKAAEKEAHIADQRKKAREGKKQQKFKKPQKMQENQQPTKKMKEDDNFTEVLQVKRSSPKKRKIEADSVPEKAESFKLPSQPPPGFKSRSVTGETRKAPPGYKPKTEPDEPAPKKHKEDSESEKTSSKVGSKPSVNKNDRTVFVSNIDYSVAEDTLQEIFSKVGSVTEIRLIRNHAGKSRGYAYVEFLDELAVPKALVLDRTPIEDRPMYVSRCEDKGTHAHKFKYGMGLEKNKLFVKGLPFTATEEALRNIFGEHGKVKEIRLVTYRSGAPKGLAYVEYEEEAAATQAILKTDGLVIGENQISVALSDPPSRRMPVKQRESTFTPSLGGGKRDTIERGRARTQLALLPRALQRTKTDAPSGDSIPADTAGNDSEASSGKMTNDDFRKLLLNK